MNEWNYMKRREPKKKREQNEKQNRKKRFQNLKEEKKTTYNVLPQNHTHRYATTVMMETI